MSLRQPGLFRLGHDTKVNRLRLQLLLVSAAAGAEDQVKTIDIDETVQALVGRDPQSWDSYSTYRIAKRHECWSVNREMVERVVEALNNAQCRKEWDALVHWDGQRNLAELDRER